MNDSSEESCHYKGNLGAWLHTQKRAKKGQGHTNKMSSEQLALLQLLVDEGIRQSY